MSRHLPGGAEEKQENLNQNSHRPNRDSSVIRIIKSRRMRWAGHVARMGEKKNAYRILVGKPGGKRH
jgi:hypothetical protein